MRHWWRLLWNAQWRRQGSNNRSRLRRHRTWKVQWRRGIRHEARLSGPDNEAPFFNFAKDRQMPPSTRVTSAPFSTRFRTARKRLACSQPLPPFPFFMVRMPPLPAGGYNQAFLIDAQQSLVYHGYAILVSEHFHDHKFADELMRVAARMNSPDPSLIADHGSVLLDLDRPTEARLLLERAAKANPIRVACVQTLRWRFI